MSLKDYRKKRKFDKTPEPKGIEKQSTGPLTFVIQKHEASRLHYDFRLELNGVLKSWAIPKGPSTNPEDKRLAVMVEDHPMEYANFEGIIPNGNYGAGSVMVWDRGVYSPIAFVDRKKAQTILAEQLEKGHLTFVLLGEKLKGEFALVKTHNTEENAWLLIKANDEYASKKDVLTRDSSVLTNRTMHEIENQAIKKSEIWISKPSLHNVARLPKGELPIKVKPMLAQPSDEPFDDTDWIFEMKYDGYRAIAEIRKRTVLLYSRNGIVYNEKFNPIITSLQKFPADVVFDGEIVVVDAEGKPHFQWLQEYPESKEGELLYYVFDVLHYDGHDLTSLPLYRRKELLQEILPQLPHIQYASHIEENGIEMFRHIKKLGLEGIMAKNKQSTYIPGIRTTDWLKIKIKQTQEVLIAGFTKPKGNRKHFRALILGMYDKGTLKYIGHVGGGFNEKRLQEIYTLLQPIIRKTCPFKTVPETNAPATWVEPTLIAEITFSEWTQDHQVRHPIFLGLRHDKEVHEITQQRYFAKEAEKEEHKEVTVDSQTLTFTNLSKTFWPEERYTKGNLIEYYKEIAPVILPYLKDRPESLLRYPNGIYGTSFYQKDAGKIDEPWIKKISIHSESNSKDIPYLLCQNKTTLLYLINLGCIDLNPWSSRIHHLDYPDFLIIDLDPEKVEFTQVVKTALAAQEILESLNISSYPKTSGAKGMHIYIPLGAMYTYEQSRKLAELLCIYIHNKVPNLTSLKRNPKDRQGRVYLDFLQNIRGQTLASPYSVRAQSGATVSAPLLWSEVTPKLHPSQFTMKNMARRIQKHGDLFKGVLGKGIAMEKVLDAISQMR